MKNTIKTILAIAAIGLGLSANAAIIPSTGTVYMENTDYDGGTGKYNIGGGEFKATIPGFDAFYTFCVEIDQSIQLPGWYDYSVSSAVDSNGDVVSKGTAYLFEKFVKGLLYERTLDAAHDEIAGYLQAAIWILEEEDYSGKSSLALDKFFNLATNPFIGLVETAFGSIAAAQVNDDQGRVKILNLTLGGEEKQDVLVYVPDSGTTLALFGFALAGLTLFRRRR